MAENKEEQILEKMMTVASLASQSIKDENIHVEDVNYYEQFDFEGITLANGIWIGNNIYVAKIQNEKDNTSTYEIYSGNTNSLIATVNEQGKLRFTPQYIEMIRQKEPTLAVALSRQEWDFELPQDLAREDRVLTRKERESLPNQRSSGTLEKAKQQENSQENMENESQNNKSQEEQQQEEIAKKKGVPANNVLFVKENSNFYKDHPNLEPNLYFYKDKDGIIKAEYLDENGVPQPSNFFEESTTSLRQETVSLGDDGDPVTKEVPYQVMRTKNLNGVDNDIRDIRISVKIDSYGYLELEESRQGKNGEWLSHNIEVKGRDYNSRAVNASTSIRTRKADPDKQTEAYERAEDTGLAKDDIQYSEMYIISHSNEVIEALIKQGYQKKEAVQIIDYVIGEEKLTFKEAKEKVNKEIGKENKEKSKEANEFMHNEEENDGGRTQGRRRLGKT